jgi:hypothetical protein
MQPGGDSGRAVDAFGSPNAPLVTWITRRWLSDVSEFEYRGGRLIPSGG